MYIKNKNITMYKMQYNYKKNQEQKNYSRVIIRVVIAITIDIQYIQIY